MTIEDYSEDEFFQLGLDKLAEEWQAADFKPLTPGGLREHCLRRKREVGSIQPYRRDPRLLKEESIHDWLTTDLLEPMDCISLEARSTYVMGQLISHQKFGL